MGDRSEGERLSGESHRADRATVNRLLPLVYDELHRLARGYFRRERPDHTLQPTALVNEAYLRLRDQRAPIESRGHFLALAATQMRRVLLDHARKHHRRAGGRERVTLADTAAICGVRPLDLIALDSALNQLARLDASQAQLVELRYFGGLSAEEAAGAMGISLTTVKRRWNSARAFLKREIEGGAIDVRAVGADPADI